MTELDSRKSLNSHRGWIRTTTGHDSVSVLSDGSGQLHPHVGLKNLNRRLYLMYGRRSILRIQSIPNQKTTISFDLPLHLPTKENPSWVFNYWSSMTKYRSAKHLPAIFPGKNTIAPYTTRPAMERKPSKSWRHPVDLVITDVKMPLIDGIELSKYIYDNYPDTCFILSGYAEFEYAQSAMRYHVSEYLLKPVSKDKLIAAVQNTLKQKKSVPVASKNAESDGTKYSIFVKQAMTLIQEHLTEDLSLEWIAEHVHSNASYLSRVFKKKWACLWSAILQIFGSKKAKDLLEHSDLKTGEISEAVGIQWPCLLFCCLQKVYRNEPKGIQKQPCVLISWLLLYNFYSLIQKITQTGLSVSIFLPVAVNLPVSSSNAISVIESVVSFAARIKLPRPVNVIKRGCPPPVLTQSAYFSFPCLLIRKTCNTVMFPVRYYHMLSIRT